MTRQDYHLDPKRWSGPELLDRLASGESGAGRNLPAVQLAGAELEGADLSGANLRGADLRGAKLAGARLGRARLEGANLEGADLRGADLGMAILGAANLGGADLSGANLERSNLVGTCARGANASRAAFFYSRPGSADFSGADLRGADLTRAIFRAADLRGANREGAKGKPTLDRTKTGGAPDASSSWAPLTAPEDCPSEPPLLFGAFLLPEVNEANVYVAACPETRRGVLIDAGGYSDEVVEFVRREGLTIDTVFITHAHYDHTGGLDRYRKAFGRPRVLSGGGSWDRVGHGETVEVGALEATVLDTTGHTTDSFTLAFGQIAFTGDALFAGSIGGTSSDESNRRERDNIRSRLFVLHEACELYSGHGPGTTVHIEKTYNPFFV